ncbi:MAG: ferrochelatase [Acidimicrobiales bacterium]
MSDTQPRDDRPTSGPDPVAARPSPQIDPSEQIRPSGQVGQSGQIGVVLMAHGTPPSLEELAPFVTELRRGRPPEPQLLAELERRYLAIGGISPLAERSRWHAEALAEALEARAPGRFVVELGYKYAAPRIEDAVKALGRRGVTKAVGLVLAPHYSVMSIGDYAKRASDAGAMLDPPIEVSTVHQWYLAPGFVPLVAELVRKAITELPENERFAATAVFTAHSLPERILDIGDPYRDQLLESAAAIAAAADVERFMAAWQSAGRSAEKWLGPDVVDVIAELPATGTTAVVICPVGFVSEHLEVLFDLDVEARAAAERAGIRYMRTASLDYDPRLSEVLAGVITDTANALEAKALETGSAVQPDTKNQLADK